jgi:nicotinate phosphoribosyltransferase
MFHTANFDEIRAGKVSDVYFYRTRQVLEKTGIRKKVRMEVAAKTLPRGRTWAVFAGLEEVMFLLSGMPVNVRGLAEGTVFRIEEPVLEIEGDYLEFGHLETAILGLICQASGIATEAARCKKNAGHRPVLSFGARRLHPAIAPMIERNAFAGGCDGVAVVKSAELLGIPPAGTVPHALILIMGSIEKAMEAFDRIIEPGVKRVALVDTLCDEKFEALRAARALGKKLFGVRLDTPSSRRGDFEALLREVRWELDIRGFSQVKLFVSGGIDAEKISELNPFVDAYGVGTSISNAPVIDFSMDIVEIEGTAFTKRGKASGSKDVFRCGECMKDIVVKRGVTVRRCECGGTVESILKDMLSEGVQVSPLLPPAEIREKVLTQIARIE